MPHLYCPPIWNQAPSPFRPENYKSRPSCLGLAANTKPGQSTFGLLGYWTGTRSNAVFGNCTTRLRNTHGTEEREVLYPWHPWYGCLVRIHEVVDWRCRSLQPRRRPFGPVAGTAGVDVGSGCLRPNAGWPEEQAHLSMGQEGLTPPRRSRSTHPVDLSVRGGLPRTRGRRRPGAAGLQ